jgi:hypothetical protein
LLRSTTAEDARRCWTKEMAEQWCAERQRQSMERELQYRERREAIEQLRQEAVERQQRQTVECVSNGRRRWRQRRRPGGARADVLASEADALATQLEAQME